MNGAWMTPEEIAWKKKRNKHIGYALIPLFSILVGALISLLAS